MNHPPDLAAALLDEVDAFLRAGDCGAASPPHLGARAPR
jgi:hypothetical protein